ncbi:fibronectin type III domain-containing protein [Tellurirhabdus rosea]|uniref:hypothetical protein n=1 Tax=Tellurirhabdus rosea TaxID=2674997 RepID=UPI002255F1C8|nr:hypothetical protein [Tellurirhabdus rosea]
MNRPASFLLILAFLLLLGAAATAQDLDFLSVGYPPGATAHTYSGVGNPPVNVDIAISGPGVFSNSSPSATGPGLTTTSVNFSNNTEKKTYTFTFSAPVLGLLFDLRAINQNLSFTNPNRNYQDQVTVTATNGLGQPVAVSFSANPAEAIVSGNTITANSSSASSPVGVSFGDGVQVLTIVFGNGPAAGSNPDANGFTIGDMAWSALPVELVSFRATSEAGGVRLDWETAWEKAADRFVVERSLTAAEFIPLAEQPARGTIDQRQAYVFFDASPLRGTSYYRLRQVDRDGSSSYSEIVSVIRDPDAPLLEVVGNPILDGRIRLRLRNLLPESLTLSRLDGRAIAFTLPMTTGEEATITPTELLQPGVYLLRALVGRHSLVRKVVVQ